MPEIQNRPGSFGHDTFSNSVGNEGLRQAVTALEEEVAALEAALGTSFDNQLVMAAGPSSAVPILSIPIPTGINKLFSIRVVMVAATANPSYTKQVFEVMVARDSQGFLVDDQGSVSTSLVLGGASAAIDGANISGDNLRITAANADTSNQAELCIRGTIDVDCVLETVDIPAA